MTGNEFNWWQAWHCVALGIVERMDLLLGRVISTWTGQDGRVDFFDPMRDSDYKKEQADKLYNELVELDKKHKAKLKREAELKENGEKS